ncbi:MAG TPA: MarR family transcriptional regulator [Burkholderiaceae bacterium]|nr:MarR family transcriptional regulator [Burkholderiaceae bacterium]
MASHQESLGFLLADLSRLMRRAFEQRLQGSSLTLAQGRALVYLSRREGIRQGELAGLLEVQPITLARLVDQLAEAGLVERRPDLADRRAYRLHLTAAAAPHLSAIAQVAETIRTDALRDMTEQQINALFSALHTIHSNLTHPSCLSSGEEEQ